MHKKQTANPYFAFRFLLIAHDSGEAIDAATAYHDPFVRGMWIGRAHMVDRKPMPAFLSEQTKLDVYLLTAGNGTVRRITVEYDGIDWFPVDFDAAQSAVAMEWVLLKDAKYTSYEDIEFDKLSEELSSKLRIGPSFSPE